MRLIAFAVLLLTFPAAAQTASADLDARVRTLEARVAALEARLALSATSPCEATLAPAAVGAWREIANWARLARGMSKAEVVALIGPPLSAEALASPEPDGSTQRWHFDRASGGRNSNGVIQYNYVRVYFDASDRMTRAVTEREGR